MCVSRGEPSDAVRPVSGPHHLNNSRRLWASAKRWFKLSERLLIACACSSMRMRRLSREGKGGTPDQAAAGINEGDIEKSYMKLPKAHMGRPPVHDLLASLCEQHGAETSIGVIAAGMALEPSSVAGIPQRHAFCHQAFSFSIHPC